jgi:hypothetical protein
VKFVEADSTARERMDFPWLELRETVSLTEKLRWLPLEDAWML